MACAHKSIEWTNHIEAGQCNWTDHSIHINKLLITNVFFTAPMIL